MDTLPAFFRALNTNHQLWSIGIDREIISTPSHGEESISLIMDNGDCFVGDLEPYEYLHGYEDISQLQKDWNLILSKYQKRIRYAHANEKNGRKARCTNLMKKGWLRWNS